MQCSRQVSALEGRALEPGYIKAWEGCTGRPLVPQCRPPNDQRPGVIVLSCAFWYAWTPTQHRADQCLLAVTGVGWPSTPAM